MPKLHIAVLMGGWSSERPVSLMSGGIDSVCLLRSNHLIFPEGHPDRIRAVLSIAQRAQPVAGKMLMRKIPSTGESLPVIGVGTAAYNQERAKVRRAREA